MIRVIGLLFVVACGSSDPAPEPTWQAVDADEPSALLAVWGHDARDVWVVGSRAANAGPAILHYDGDAWSWVDSGQTNLDLWWVFGFENGDVLFSGSGGTVLRYRQGQFERLPTPSATGTIFGMWGPAADDVWAVGNAGSAGGVVWHWDGQAFTPIPIPGPAVPHVFKVHGQASNDVWMSCAGGVTLHWDGTALTRIATPTTESLFSIITTPKLAVAVGGGGGMGDLFENASGDWSPTSLETPVAWRGTAAIDDDLAVVGEFGLVARRSGSTWNVLRHDLTTLNFHSAWLDDEHGLWVVGGLFDGRLSDGLLLYYGGQTIAKVSQ